MSISYGSKASIETSFILAWKGVYEGDTDTWRSIHILLGLKWAYGDSGNMEAFADASLLYSMAIDIITRILQDEFQD